MNPMMLTLALLQAPVLTQAAEESQKQTPAPILAQPAAPGQLPPAAPAQVPLAYRFDEVRRTVRQWPGGDRTRELRPAKGDPAAAGDIVRTGWFGQTVLSVPSHSARFEVFANAQVRLADGEPGVLMVVERGRVKAFFDRLLDGEAKERRLAVPGALLAVRGTRYGVDVDPAGNSILVVFEGVVEVMGRAPGTEPIRVRAGEWSTFGPRNLPKVQPGPLHGFDERSWAQGVRPSGSFTGPTAPSPWAPGGTTPRDPRNRPPWHH